MSLLSEHVFPRSFPQPFPAFGKTFVLSFSFSYEVSSPRVPRLNPLISNLSFLSGFSLFSFFLFPIFYGFLSLFLTQPQAFSRAKIAEFPRTLFISSFHFFAIFSCTQRPQYTGFPGIHNGSVYTSTHNITRVKGPLLEHLVLC